jgi:hypothetical protein
MLEMENVLVPVDVMKTIEPSKKITASKIFCHQFYEGFIV